ncbi:hypothetical protein RLW55_08800 [Hyphomicrobium sp. B1]|uniref:hypothetical protein n=1 Tax=Hyphomicrobium sp. B1 TaxID=3075651 RepID=UPI003C2F303A
MSSEKSEEPDSEPLQRFFMAPDPLGHWIVQDQAGRRSGYFINREWARKFALAENGHRPDLLIELPEASALTFTQIAFHNDSSNGGLSAYRKAA